MIMVLIVLFLGKQSAESDRRWVIPSRLTSRFRPRSDAVREVQKYSGPEPMLDAKGNPNVYDHVHMKLFRAQRNLYISGFSLFLWLSVSFLLFIQNNTIMFVGPSSKTLPLQKTAHLLTQPLWFTFWGPAFFSPLFWSCEHSIMRRVVTLLNQVAVTLEDNTGLQAQMDSAVKAAKQCQDDNMLLKQVSPKQSLTTGLKPRLLSFSRKKKIPFLPRWLPSTVVT